MKFPRHLNRLVALAGISAALPALALAQQVIGDTGAGSSLPGAATQASSADCGDVQVDESLMGKPRNQGDMGLCYAYSAADLLTHCLNQAKTKRVSAKFVPDGMSGKLGRPGGKVVDTDGNAVDYGSELVDRSDVQDLTEDQQASAFEMGLNYDYADPAHFDQSKPSLLIGSFENGGGDQAQVIRIIDSMGGFCTEDHFPSDAYSYDQVREEHGMPGLIDGKSDIETTSTLVNKIMGYKVLYDAYPAGQATLACRADAIQWPAVTSATQVCSMDTKPDPQAWNGTADVDPRFHFLSGSRPDIFRNQPFLEILANSTQLPPSDKKTADQSLMHILDTKLCTAEQRVPLGPSCSKPTEYIVQKDNSAGYSNVVLPPQAIAKIDEQLNQAIPQPVGIGVWAHVLHGTISNGQFDAAGNPMKVDDPDALGANLKSEGGHAILITGRRMKGGVCQYRIRNSWGRSCHAQYTNGTTDLDPSGQMYGKYVDCRDEDGGYLYMSREVLSQALASVSYLPNASSEK